MIRQIARVVALTACVPLVAQSEGPKPEADGNPKDWVSPDALAAAVYSVVSGPAGAPRDWDRYRGLFRDDARFIAFGGTDDEPEIYEFGVEEYIEWYGPDFDKRGIYETEISSRTEKFRRLAQRWSTCEFRWAKPTGPADGRCLTSMEFLYDGERWWITSMMWESEEPQQPIPHRFLESTTSSEPESSEAAG